MATGLTVAIGGPWGLFRHYWVATKFLLTALTTALLLLHQFTAVAEAARLASASGPTEMPPIGRLGIQLMVDSGLALAMLTFIAALSVFKPWGETAYGRRLRSGEADRAGVQSTEQPGLPRGVIAMLVGFGAVVAGVIVAHLSGAMSHHHRH
jgi:hypothetical protein